MLLAIALLTAVHAKGVSSVSIVLRSYAETAVSGRSRVGNGGPSATNMPRVTNMLPQRAIGTAADAAFSK